MINLTPEQIDTLRGYEDTLNIIAHEIGRAKEAGIDMTDIEARYNKVKALRDGILKVYAPTPGRARRVV